MSRYLAEPYPWPEGTYRLGEERYPDSGKWLPDRHGWAPQQAHRSTHQPHGAARLTGSLVLSCPPSGITEYSPSRAAARERFRQAVPIRSSTQPFKHDSIIGKKRLCGQGSCSPWSITGYSPIQRLSEGNLCSLLETVSRPKPMCVESSQGDNGAKK